ncbi:MAG: BatA domain-containing protein [Planctomycetes bacterium]|nr:BatA domain-containing protein [Planctomycetota bacterium]
MDPRGHPMSFVHPSFLWALPLAAIPILIYYLMRYRSLRVAWGAYYVLERALERLRKKLYLDQMLLLAVRTLACAGLVFAFARPSTPADVLVPAASSSGMHRVVLLDTSASMLASERGADTRWERCMAALRALVVTWGRGEVWSLYRLSDPAGWALDGRTVQTPEKTLAALEALRPGEGAASLSKALEAVFEKFPSGPGALYLFGDDQASTWAGLDSLKLPSGWKPRLYWVHPPLENRGNLAVTAVRFPSHRALVGHPCRLFIAARNFGPRPVQDAEIEVRVDGAFTGKTTISLLPGQELWTHLDLAWDVPGPHHVSARTGKDALEFDNVFSAGIEVSEKIAVVVLQDPGRTGKFDSAWEFLQIAGRVQKLADGEGQPVFNLGPLVFSRIQGDVSAPVLAGTDVVLLDGGRTVTPELAGLLQECVGNGGGLVLAADENVVPEAWNDLLGRVRLLPAPLSRLRVETLGGESFKAFARNSFEHEAFRNFETSEDGDLAQARFYAWFEFGPVPEDAVSLVRFSDRQPYLLRKGLETGCVLLLASGLNGRSNNVVAREFFLPFLYRLFSEAASGGLYPRTVRRGQAIGLRLAPPPEGLRGMTFTAEGLDPVPLIPRQGPGEVRVVVAEGAPNSGLASILVARAGASPRYWFGVQGPRDDSDLAPMDTELRKRCVEKFGIVEVPDGGRLLDALKAERTGREWHHAVLLVLIALLTLEMILELRFL